MRVEKILVAPWGNPWKSSGGYRWSIVRYYFDRGKSMESRSSLPLLFDELEPSVALVIVLDTVAEGRVESYSELLNSVSQRYFDFLKELGLEESKIKLLVAPGVGRFQNGVFEGMMRDFYAFVLYEIARRLPVDQEIGELEIHLDLTHGMNFMPAMTYRAVRELAGILSQSVQVKLFVYNSEPYVRGTKELCIQLVEETSIPPSPCRRSLSHQIRLLEPFDLKSEERRTLYENDLALRTELLKSQQINAFLGSLVNGLPLVLFTFYPEINEIKKALDLAKDVFFWYVHLRFDDEKIMVRRRVGFGDDFCTLVKAYAAAMALRLERKEEVNLSMLHEIRERFFSWHKRLNSAIGTDLHKIKETMEEVIKQGKKDEFREWKPLGELIEEKGGFSKRNFLAHSGLERNVTEVKLIDEALELKEAILLRYKRDRLPDIMDTSSWGLLPAKGNS